MAFPNRALVGAPVARDLYAEHPLRHIARIPGAIVSGWQVWDTLDQDYWSALAATDTDLRVVPSLAALRALPAGLGAQLFKLVVQVQRFDDVALTPLSARFKRIADLDATDYWRVIRTADGSIVTRNGQPIAGDLRPAGARGTAWEMVHSWAGDIAETLGT